MDKKDIVITSYARTPIGAFSGSLASITAPALGSIVIKAAIERSGIMPEQVDEVIMGNVLPAGLGQAPARQAAMGAGLPNTSRALTINKMCGSGLKAVMLADQALLTGDADVILAGGMESMSNAPYIMQGVRSGLRMGHSEVIDSMIRDGLWDVYNDMHMGNCAELCAREKQFSREQQDEFAIQSYRRALEAQEAGRFEAEIVPVEVKQRRGDPLLVDRDEDPQKVKFDKVPNLRPAFDKTGSITAANASSINDGAAALVVMTGARALELGVKPVARILGQASAAHAPEWFTTVPSKAMTKVFKKTGLSVEDMELFEINEAFAVVALAAIKEFNLDPAKVNVNGGAVALGHPIGASGARILVTLLNALEQRQLRRGMASICIGGGEASALIVERL
ncbi:acetyl-CoA C-acetyltransferase [Candidatus Neomarinimicrobiota bacterium]